MKRQDYIKSQAVILKRLMDRQNKITRNKKDAFEMTPRQNEKINSDLNFNAMDIEMTKERLAFALDLLRPENARQEYRPSPFHVYKGIQGELEKTKFD